MNKTQQGFTLIELMIVIAILAILMAIAIPAYQDYTVRAKVSEGINLAGAAKLAVSETYQSEGTFPTTNNAAGLPAPTEISGNDVASVTVGTGGILTINYSTSTEPKINAGGANELVLSPFTTGGSVHWSCGAAGTTVGSRFLPATCRP